MGYLCLCPLCAMIIRHYGNAVSTSGNVWASAATAYYMLALLGYKVRTMSVPVLHRSFLLQLQLNNRSPRPSLIPCFSRFVVHTNFVVLLVRLYRQAYEKAFQWFKYLLCTGEFWLRVALFITSVHFHELAELCSTLLLVSSIFHSFKSRFLLIITREEAR